MRKVKDVAIELEGRDRGKVFRLTEMPASQAEEWGIRFITGISRSGVDLPDGMDQMGMAGIVFFGLSALSKIEWSTAKPLLDEMMACVQRVEFLASGQQGAVRVLVENDIEEVATRMWLRDQIIELHVGFTVAGVLSSLIGTQSRTTPASEENNTQISREELVP